jgi:integrase
VLEKHQIDSEFVCTKLDRRGHTVRIQSFRKAWYSACVKAELGHFDADGKYIGRIYHDLRRSGVRNLVRAGVPEGVCMKISGHKTRSVFDRYNITSGQDIADAGRKLDAYHKSLSGKVGDNSGTALHQNAAEGSAIN